MQNENPRITDARTQDKHSVPIKWPGHATRQEETDRLHNLYQVSLDREQEKERKENQTHLVKSSTRVVSS